MKILATISRIIAIALAATVFVLFFFDFVKIITQTGQTIRLTGFQLAFGSKQSVLTAKGYVDQSTYKGLWYTIAFLLSTTGLVLAALSYKFKKTAVAALIFLLLSSINLLVLFFSSSLGAYVDYRPLNIKSI